MAGSKDDEDYWNSTDKNAFSFDQSNQVDTLFGVSKSGTAELRAGISNIEVSDAYSPSEESKPHLKPLLSIISEQSLSAILTADKIYLPEEPTVVQPDITLRRILLGQPFSLEKYRSLANKTALLDAALASGDGNAILIVILFIVKSLKWSLVQRLLMERPDAVHAYVRYLSTRLQVKEITDILTMQGKSTEAAMTNLNIIIRNTTDAARLATKLLKCYETQFKGLPNCPEADFLQNYTKLLEWQIALKSTQFDQVFEVNSSVLDCLRYTCKCHYDNVGGSLTSPTTLLTQHQISPRQYQRVFLKTIAALHEWADINALFLSNSWLGKSKLQSSLPIEEILGTLAENQAPFSVLNGFLKCIDDEEKRCQLQRRYISSQ